MKIKKSTLLEVAAILAIGFVIYHNTNKKKKKWRSDNVAMEGYETAHDILYPEKTHSKNLHFGPVLPE
jgi:hypothetical protein